MLDGFSLEWRPVDPPWYPELFGWALWFTVTHAAHVIDRDPSLVECRDLPVGWEAWRDAVGEPWFRRPLEPES